MRILLVDQYGELGGAQRCLVEAAAGFAERGWELHAAAPQGPLLGALAAYGARVHGIPCGPFASGRKTAGDAARFAAQIPRQAATLADVAADLMYVNGPRLLPAASLGRRGRPLIHHVHWMVPQPAAAWLTRAALRRSGASVIATSRRAAAWLGDAVDPERVFTVYNGVAGPESPPRPRDEVRHVAVLGRIAPEKGQVYFARAARIVHERARGLRYSICGAPMFSDAEYFERVRREAAGAPVEFPGWVENTGELLRGVDLLVVPSGTIDNIPRVILEAFAAGTPVLAFDSGAIPELIEDGVTGLLVRQHTPAALAEAILKAVARPEQLNRIALQAWRRWQERYTLRRFQSDICAAVEAVARRHHQRSPLANAGAKAPA